MTVNPTPYHYHDAAVERQQYFTYWWPQYSELFSRWHTLFSDRLVSPTYELGRLQEVELLPLHERIEPLQKLIVELESKPVDRSSELHALWSRHNKLLEEREVSPNYRTAASLIHYLSGQEQQIEKYKEGIAFLESRPLKGETWIVTDTNPFPRRTFRQWFIDTFLP